MNDLAAAARLHGPVHDPAAAERFAAAVTVAMGFSDAMVTPAGPDGGLDVVGRDVAGQVKYQQRPVGRPEVQKLAGAASGRKAFFFSSGGYSAEAVDWAELHSVATFTFDSLGNLYASGALAELYMKRGAQVGAMSGRQVQLRDRSQACTREVELLGASMERLASRHKLKRSELRRLQAAREIWDQIQLGFDKLSRIAEPGGPIKSALVAPFADARLDSALREIEQNLARIRRKLGA
jgi:hypothetical protein